ncbi:phosphoglycerate mutase [Lysobacter sp. TY2-98]|uniref:phosphoglycerate mutase n=1 Tax=Lysobacter sp. TY2-98 TaxID=2290922 RepID=UPI000E1FBD3D|nr:phosphoglycerate mutase [Lysobacter sp. TY2-98]AXK71817.1 phosphoglycerate mutase [Lysobacter sp. TY2-98]
MPARAVDVTFVLPSRQRFAGELLPDVVARALGRADRAITATGVEILFDVLPRGWPAAAVTRQAECGDAGDASWVRADPAYVRADINGARLLAIGEMLGLDADASEALLRPLRPLFGDAGMPIDAGRPNAWYLRLAPGSPLPTFPSPDDALGSDLFEQMPQGPEGRRWRALMSEAQVLLHHHPINADRLNRGLAPINSIWFWGAGRLPDHVRTSYGSIHSQDPTVRAFAQLAGVTVAPLEMWSLPDGDAAFDLRPARNFAALCQAWIEPALAAVAAKRIGTLRLMWADGERFDIRRSQSLRFWKRPLRGLAERDDE